MNSSPFYILSTSSCLFYLLQLRGPHTPREGPPCPSTDPPPPQQRPLLLLRLLLLLLLLLPHPRWQQQVHWKQVQQQWEQRWQQQWEQRWEWRQWTFCCPLRALLWITPAARIPISGCIPSGGVEPAGACVSRWLSSKCVRVCVCVRVRE